MRALIFPVLLASSITAMAAPCDEVDRGLSLSRQLSLPSIVERQLGISPVQILGSMSEGTWSILSVLTPQSDPPFLFFSDNPQNSHFVTLWAGAASAKEEFEVKSWVIEHAPGIPSSLAACFAWHVSVEH
ncbi:hypothetical protein [Nevskia ramosa]|uniref:hypothetical protein n=1 Tax=Nevskia ramosa TaxID=64002 RepID=UPI003D0CA3DF